MKNLILSDVNMRVKDQEDKLKTATNNIEYLGDKIKMNEQDVLVAKGNIAALNNIKKQLEKLK